MDSWRFQRSGGPIGHQAIHAVFPDAKIGYFAHGTAMCLRLASASTNRVSRLARTLHLP